MAKKDDPRIAELRMLKGEEAVDKLAELIRDYAPDADKISQSEIVSIARALVRKKEIEVGTF